MLPKYPMTRGHHPQIPGCRFLRPQVLCCSCAITRPCKPLPVSCPLPFTTCACVATVDLSSTSPACRGRLAPMLI